MLPFLEVAHLPSSSSFYSAIIQPLGLRYLSTEDGHFPTITFGDRLGAPVFELHQIAESRSRPPKLSHIVLSAPSATTAEDVYEFALRAAPDVRERERYPEPSVTRSLGGGGKIRVSIVDYDGNTMEIVYRPPPEYGSHYGGSTVRATQSTPKEASRIMSWNYDVASSELPPSTSRSGASSRGRYADDEPYSSLKRSMTDGPGYESLPSPRQNSSGLSASTVVGTLLGVAAGAALGGALTYSRVKSDRSRAPRQEYDAPAPTFTRRSTMPDPYPDPKTRYVDVERAVEKVRYPDDYPPAIDHRLAPEYIARYSQAEGSTHSKSRDVSRSRSREVEDIYEDNRSRHSYRSRPASVRHRSEASSNRQPLLLDDTEPEYRSHVSSRSKGSRHPPIVQRSYTYEPAYDPPTDMESYVSAKSRRSSGTIRAGGPPEAGESRTMVSRTKSGSKVTTTVKVGGGSGSRAPTYVSARGVPLPESRAPTYISARGVPLPESRAATYISAREVRLPPSTHTRYDDDESDKDSVVPDDSISCVGSRGSRRYR